MGRVVQVLITHFWNDAFTTDVDEYVKKIFYWVSKHDFVIGLGRFRILGGPRFRILGGPRGAKFPAGT